MARKPKAEAQTRKRSAKAVESPSSAKPRNLRRRVQDKNSELAQSSNGQSDNEASKSISDKLSKYRRNSKQTVPEEKESPCLSGNNEKKTIYTPEKSSFPDIDFSMRRTLKFSCGNHPVSSFSSSSRNIMHCVSHLRNGQRVPSRLSKSLTSPVSSLVSDLQLFRTASPFNRRTTAMEWHPTNPNLLVAGSKAGDIILWNINAADKDIFIPGQGPGGSIQAVKFWSDDHTQLLTASINGQVALRDMEGRHTKVFLDTMDYNFWYCCVDVCPTRKLLVTGDNVGNTTLLSMDGQKLWRMKLHKNKVTHAEFSPREDWLFCTASTDKTVQVWDVRKVKDKKSALYVLPHEKPINSAYFSGTDGMRLLTTDQNSEIRIYRSPLFHMERVIQHPHRCFQHITPIKASWHPLQDLVVVGRYPDPAFPGYTETEKRTIDIYDGETGNLVSQLQDPGAPGIISLNKFSSQGDSLASGMGVNLLVWGRREEVAKRQEELMNTWKKQGIDPSNSNQGNQRQPRPKKDKNKGKKTEDLKTKLKLKEKNTKKK